MKVLVFAHVPPPHHGQSQMVQYLVEGLRARPELGVEVVHIDARLSEDLTDVGRARGGKLRRLLAHCVAAVRARRRTGATVFYYVPAPPQLTPLRRDWLVMLLVRPWFRHTVFHWQAVGLGRWVNRELAGLSRLVSRHLLGRADLSLALAPANAADAAELAPRRVAVVSNGVADPCPDFAARLAPARRARAQARRTAGGEVEALFLALCSRDKGVFDALEAVRLANELTAAAGETPALRFRLRVAGTFPTAALEQEFVAAVQAAGMAAVVERLGFVAGAAKRAALERADLLLFPTYYAAEGQPLSLMEAMAYGLPPVTTRWRGIPEMLPGDYAGLVEPRQPAALAAALLRVAREEDGGRFRALYEQRFTVAAHLEAVAAALRSLAG
jgi:glycosyltransferase involved in cell wall biosynthesis